MIQKLRARTTAAWRGPRLPGATLAKVQGLTPGEAEGATWRGWLLGCLAVAAIAAVTPYIDFILRGTRLSFTAFPMAPVVIVLVVTGLAAAALRLCGSTLGLTRQDVMLAFCMTMVTYALAGFGFFMVWSATVTVPWYEARPENNWVKTLQPLVQAAPTSAFFLPPDPPTMELGAIRPIEWFYLGLPEGRSIPWGVWVRPYLLWCVVILLLYGIWFSLAGLLSRRWSEQERLPFPLAQVPDEMTAGLARPDKGSWLLANRLALWGLLIPLAIHVYNMAAAHLTFLQSIELMHRGLDKKYFTEPPWNAMGTFSVQLSFTIVGMTFLLSREVAFSLWLFFFLKKLIYLLFGQTRGVSAMTDVTQGQGTGALLMLALVSFWAARSELFGSLRQAFRSAKSEDGAGDVAPRRLWGVLALCAVGVVVWLGALGVSPLWATVSVVVLVLMMTGLTRLVAEAGAYAALVLNFPTRLMSWVATPALIGGKNVFFLNVWDRLLGADFFRIVPFPLVMNALHAARISGLRQRAAFAGMTLAVVLTLGVSFFSYLGTIYPGGQNQIGDWYARTMVARDMDQGRMCIEAVDRWERKVAEAERTGRPLTKTDDVARTEWGRLSWLALGAGVLAVLSAVRGFVTWCPHPAGYVMWMCSPPHDTLWFSFFLGWFFKWGITQYGGMRMYLAWRRFFIGLVVGESLAVILGILLSWITGEARFNIWMS